jgi:hypothetical protein
MRDVEPPLQEEATHGVSGTGDHTQPQPQLALTRFCSVSHSGSIQPLCSLSSGYLLLFAPLAGDWLRFGIPTHSQEGLAPYFSLRVKSREFRFPGSEFGSIRI